MTGYSIAQTALEDPDEIDNFVAAENPAAAQRIANAIFDAFDTLAERPGIGHRRTDLTKRAVRFWTVMSRYMIAYREGPDGIEIVRVLGPGRDVATALR